MKNTDNLKIALFCFKLNNSLRFLSSQNIQLVWVWGESNSRSLPFSTTVCEGNIITPRPQTQLIGTQHLLKVFVDAVINHILEVFIKMTEKIKLPIGFKEKYEKLTNWAEFGKFFYPVEKSIRVNTLKISVSELRKRLEKKFKVIQIPWCPEGFWISSRYKNEIHLGSLEESEQGLFYIQEAASMIPPLVLNPKPKEKILDMCASPGSKTTQIAQYMQNKGTLIANDIRKDRIAILERNLKRTGSIAVVTMQPGQQFKDVKFDKILVDAPCSGTGTIRNTLNFKDWNPETFERLSFEQKSLLHSAYNILKKGGLLVYSTCSMEPEENELVVDWLLKRHKKTNLEEITINLKRSKPILTYNKQKLDTRIKKTLRIWPQDNNTSGFFVAKIRKL